MRPSTAHALHVVYGGDALYHAWKSGDGWSAEVVNDSLGVGRFAGLAIGADDRLHVVYYDDENAALRYAFTDDTGWQVEIIDDVNLGSNPYPAIAVGSSGRVHVSYYRSATADLYYAVRNGGAWQLEAVDTAGDVGRYTSLAVDRDDHAHVSYQDASNGDLRYAYQDGSGWHVQTVVDEGETGMDTSIALDENGYAHIAYREPGYVSGALAYVYEDGSGWHYESADQDYYDQGALGIGFFVALDFDANGRPVIGYMSYHMSAAPYPWYWYYNMRYAVRLGADSWDVEKLQGIRGKNTSLVLDASGQPNFTYQADVHYGQGMILTHLVRAGDGWTAEVIDVGGDVGRYASLAANDAGQIRVGSLDLANLYLRYAVRDDAGWYTETVDERVAYAVTGRVSLDVDGAGYPHILYDVYQRFENMVYAYEDGAGWHYLYSLAHSGWGHGYTLAVDRQGRPHVSFGYNADAGGLHYGYREDAADEFTIERVNNEPVATTDLALDPAGDPYIAYNETGRGALKVVHKDPAGWYTHTVDSSGTLDPSLALDRHNYPRVSYYDVVNGDLRYASWDGAAWQIVTVDSTGDVGQHNSLVLDGDGRAYISYYDASNGDLKFAYQDAQKWHTMTLDAEGDVGRYTSIVLSPRPGIAYYDVTHRDLKYIYLPFEPTDFAYLPFVGNN